MMPLVIPQAAVMLNIALNRSAVSGAAAVLSRSDRERDEHCVSLWLAWQRGRFQCQRLSISQRRE